MALTRINNNSLSAVTAAGIPKASGEVLNVYRYEYQLTAASGGSDTITSTSFVDFRGLDSISYTPKVSGSKLIIDFRIQMRAFATPAHGDVSYYTRGLVNGSEVIQQRWVGDNLGKLGDSIWLPQQMNFTAEYTTVSTSAITISAQGKVHTAGSNNQIQVPHHSDGLQYHSVIVTEIAG